MSVASTPPVTSHLLRVPGAELYCEVRGEGPPVVLVGAPMGADAFAPLADLLAADHNVITTDPRGIGRSKLDDPDQDAPPELRADDLSRILTALDVGPATVFGSSGGAVTALALLQAHPDQVERIVAHEPPLEELLADREERRATTEAIVAAYRDEGPGAAWALFMQTAGLDTSDGGPDADGGSDADDADGGPDADDATSTDPESAAPEPRERDPQEVADERHFFLHQLHGTTHWEPDLALLRLRSSRVVIGIGEASAGQVCDDTSRALAAELEIEPTLFPGGHGGFADDPEVFLPRLQEVLQGQ